MTKALAASPTPPAEPPATTEAALGGVYAELPDFDSGDEPIWEAVFKWKAANPGSDASKKAMAVEAAIIKSLRDFADRTHALRQQAAPKAAPGEPDGFGSAEHWKEKAQYWAGVAHRLRGEALRGEPVDGIVHPPAPQQEAQEPAFVDVSLRTAIAKAVYQQVRVEFDYKLGSWTALDADEQQRIVDSIRGLYTTPQPTPAPLSESEYKRGYRDGYERRDAEVRGALV